MKKGIVYGGICIIILFLLLFGSYKLMNARTYQLAGEITPEVKTKEKVVALTFDDGPSKNVDKLLELLKEHNVKATFFLIGRDIEKFPEQAREIVHAGHQVGNHTYSHKRMVFKSPSYIKEEIEKTDQFIREAGYGGEIDFRPPNGKKLVALPYYLNKHDRETIMWNIEPDSYFSKADDIVKHVNEEVTPGSIILLHPMYDESGEVLQAVEGIIQELTAKGYTFVTVNELQNR